MSTQVMHHKFEDEELTLDFDFLSRMGSGEAAATAAASISVYAGVDATPNIMVSGLASVSNNIVSQKIIGGEPGVIYLVTVSVRSTLNNIYINEAKLAVLPDNSMAPAELA